MRKLLPLRRQQVAGRSSAAPERTYPCHLEKGGKGRKLQGTMAEETAGRSKKGDTAPWCSIGPGKGCRSCSRDSTEEFHHARNIHGCNEPADTQTSRSREKQRKPTPKGSPGMPPRSSLQAVKRNERQ